MYNEILFHQLYGSREGERSLYFRLNFSIVYCRIALFRPAETVKSETNRGCARFQAQITS